MLDELFPFIRVVHIKHQGIHPTAGNPHILIHRRTSLLHALVGSHRPARRRTLPTKALTTRPKHSSTTAPLFFSMHFKGRDLLVPRPDGSYVVRRGPFPTGPYEPPIPAF